VVSPLSLQPKMAVVDASRALLGLGSPGKPANPEKLRQTPRTAWTPRRDDRPRSGRTEWTRWTRLVHLPRLSGGKGGKMTAKLVSSPVETPGAGGGPRYLVAAEGPGRLQGASLFFFLADRWPAMTRSHDTETRYQCPGGRGRRASRDVYIMDRPSLVRPESLLPRPGLSSVLFRFQSLNSVAVWLHPCGSQACRPTPKMPHSVHSNQRGEHRSRFAKASACYSTGWESLRRFLPQPGNRNPVAPRKEGQAQIDPG